MHTKEPIFPQNDSSAHLDAIPEGIFSIALHPLLPQLIAVGSSDREDLGGILHIRLYASRTTRLAGII
ncbi:hypothetical protein DL95DRAFT_395375 [Leptodontidium sp. 2 PMI_412]|nr:hypothetical protein DL95DRAFT_395375 [Leptodontidium sp. 2 PMI_412]